MNEAKRYELSLKRTQVILGTWKSLMLHNKLNPARLRISVPLVNEVVEYYLADHSALRERYKIKDRIQLHKIAGLTTSAILRFRPIIPLTDEYESDFEMYCNEIFAVFHGIAICGELAAEETLAIIEEDWFDRWFKDFIFLLHHRNYTSEGLIFIYETLCCLRFPQSLEKSSD